MSDRPASSAAPPADAVPGDPAPADALRPDPTPGDGEAWPAAPSGPVAADAPERAPFPALLAYDRPPSFGPGAGFGGRGRPWIGLVAAGVWLVYLTPAAAHVVVGDWAIWQRVAAVIALALFVGLYLTTLVVAIPARAARNARRDGRVVTWPARGDREMALRTSVLAVVALASALAFGPEWLPMVAFVAAVLAVVLDPPWPPRAIVGVAVVAELLLLLRGDDGDGASYFWIGFAVLVAGFVTYATRRRNELEGELAHAREQNARLAVVDERERIARDLHDLLGHSLSVIAVKSQLAERLLERDEPGRAATEIREVRGVARDALHEVRHVVDGYRRRPLAAEVASSAAALRSAGLEVATELPDRPIPQDVEDVLAFVVREGTTNVLRHGRADHATLAVRTEDDRVVAAVADDGPSPVAGRVVPAEPAGDASERIGGLRGLAQRLATVRGTLAVGPGPDGGTTLRATVPLDAPAPGGADGTAST